MICVKTFYKTVGVLMASFFAVLQIQAQVALSNLTAENGNKNYDAANCWAFEAVNYTNTSGQVINGSWSIRTDVPTSLLPASCFVKSPFMKLSAGNITFKIKFEEAGNATIRRVIVSYIPYLANGNRREGTLTPFDSISYTYSAQTPLPVTAQNLSFPVPAGLADNNQLYKVQISFVGTGGTSRFNADDLHIPGFYWADPSNNCYELGALNDSDHDGVSDDSDAYPLDPTKAYNSFYPSGKSYGTLMFEDLWPGTGDYDFNDLVMNYRIVKVTNADNKLVEIKATYIVKAMGATFKNGFGIQLDHIDPLAVTQVTGAKTNGAAWLQVSANGTEANQQYATVIVYDNVSEHMPNPGSIGVNTTMGKPYVTPDTVQLSIRFNPERMIDPVDANVNPFLIVNQDRGREVHITNALPTSKVNAALFGTAQDNSIPGIGSFYKSKLNLTWVLDIPENVPYMQEKVDILSGFLKLIQWAQSNGLTNTDWYLSLSGYRDDSKFYKR
jgi:LruC domain-containing protein